MNKEELLQKFIDNQKWFKNGLCIWNIILKNRKIISEAEYLHVRRLIMTYPTKAYVQEKWIDRGLRFMWKPGNITPRINFLKKHLKSK